MSIFYYVVKSNLPKSLTLKTDDTGKNEQSEALFRFKSKIPKIYDNFVVVFVQFSGLGWYQTSFSVYEVLLMVLGIFFP